MLSEEDRVRLGAEHGRVISSPDLHPIRHEASLSACDSQTCSRLPGSNWHTCGDENNACQVMDTESCQDHHLQVPLCRTWPRKSRGVAASSSRLQATIRTFPAHSLPLVDSIRSPACSIYEGRKKERKNDTGGMRKTQADGKLCLPLASVADLQAR